MTATPEKKDVPVVGSIYWDVAGQGFCQVRAVGVDKGLLSITMPCEFLNDAKTTDRRQFIQEDKFSHARFEPVGNPAQCSHAEYYDTMRAWGRRGLYL